MAVRFAGLTAGVLIVALAGCSPVATSPVATSAAATSPVATSAAATSPVATSAAATEPSGNFDVGGRTLYITCVGQGAVTVVMDAGLGADHTTWLQVMPGLESSTRVCTYDRANLGASQAAPKPRTSANVVDDLLRLLTAASINSPYLLVGHSFGGISMELFAALHPDLVAGLVLVDPTPVTFVDLECEFVDATLCERLRADWAPDRNPEGLDLAGSRAALEAAGPLPDRPLIVLAATEHHQTSITDPSIEKKVEDIWQQRQQELAASVPSGGRTVVQSGHNIQLLHPEAVIDAIRVMLVTIQASPGAS